MGVKRGRDFLRKRRKGKGKMFSRFLEEMRKSEERERRF
jgi:hypothetical protein